MCGRDDIMLQKLLFSLEPETAHAIAKHYIRLRYASCFPSRIIAKPFKLFGLTFPNRVGLAAGWDKNAECIDALFRMGFGFVEVGTVTPMPQAGNPKPRLFRIPEKQALINRMGFNNAGVDTLVEKLKTRKSSGILGVNIGKNKETTGDQAIEDYESVFKKIYPFADYIVLNISSPNTPGVRTLQSTSHLIELLQCLHQTKKNLVTQWRCHKPILIKTTVDLPSSDLEAFVSVLMDYQIAGIIISNTTLDHSAVSGCRYADEAGGLSGAPLREKTTKMIADVSTISQKKLPIIGVGGVLSAQDAQAHFDAGASLIQIFTGFVYRGPALIRETALGTV